MKTRLTRALLLAAGLAALPATEALADCKKLAHDLRTAISTQATQRYDALFKAIKADATCDAKFQAQAGRTMARSVLTTLATDSDPAAISAALRFGRPWQVLVALGYAYYDRQDFSNAGDAYQQALGDMEDAAANPTPPPESIVERIQRRAVQSGALVPPGDMFASRGFATASRPAPAVIAFFAPGSAELSDGGKTGVKAAFAGIQKVAPKSLILIGHAEAGEDAAIADARARTVAAYLDALGYAGRIETVGRGSDDPFQADDPGKLTPDQKAKLERRVEYAPGG